MFEDSPGGEIKDDRMSPGPGGFRDLSCEWVGIVCVCVYICASVCGGGEGVGSSCDILC